VTRFRSESAHSLANAAEAASRLREVGRDAAVVALTIDRTRAQVDGCTWTSIGLGLAFTTVNVQVFAADGATPWSLPWLVAWLLDPMVSILLIAVLRAEQVTARWQVPTGIRVSAVKWTCFAGTYAMNTWQAWEAGTARSVVLHSIPPVMVLLGAEVGPELRDRLTESATAASRIHIHHSDDDGPCPVAPEPLAPSTDDPSDDGVDALPDPADPRVTELVELLDGGCALTGQQAAVLHGCSERTGRRLLAEAKNVRSSLPKPMHGPVVVGLPTPLAPGPQVAVVPSSTGATS
jgi:hypothetical protein